MAIIPVSSRHRCFRRPIRSCWLQWAGFGYGLAFGANYWLTDADPRTTLTTGVTIGEFPHRKNDRQIYFSALSFSLDLGRFGLIPSLSGASRYKD